MKVSVVLPTYNESENILPLINAISAQLKPLCELEILVVDDNSPDGTFELVRTTLGADPSVVPILRTSNRGLANSIRTGLERSTGDLVVVMDTDFTHDPTELPTMLHLASVFDVVSGSRFCAGGAMQDTSHYVSSLVYNWFMRLILRTQIQDNLGGFFVIRSEKLSALPFPKIFFGYGDYFFRLMHYVQHGGMSVIEMPSLYRSRTRGKSKSNFLKLLFDYTAAVIRFKVQIVHERSLSSEQASARDDHGGAGRSGDVPADQDGQ